MITIKNARQALKSVQQFEDMIVKELPEGTQDLVALDSWEMHADKLK